MDLNSEQLAAATAPLDAHLRVVASPGSGKSRTLVARVEHLLSRLVRPESIKVVTFSRQAANDISSRLPADVSVHTIHALAFRFQTMFGQAAPNAPRVGKSLFDEESMPDERDLAEANACGPFFSVDEHVYMFKKRLETNDGLKMMQSFGRIDFLMVDEAQDLDPLQWSIVQIMAKQFKTRVFMAGDPNQNIYGFRKSQSRFLLEDVLALPHFRCLSFALSVNYRSTRPIVAFCNSIRPDARDPGNIEMVSGRGAGPTPVLACFAHKAHELDYVMKRILELLGAGESAWNISVVSRTQKDCYAFCHKMTEHGIATRVVTGDTENVAAARTYPPSVTICTMHGAKGLEWNHVFVIGAHDNFNRRLMTREEERQEANLFYVAATRAKDSLLFTSPKRIYTRHLSRPGVREMIVSLDSDADPRIVAPQGIQLPGGDPYARSVRSVTHFVKHASGEMYARLKEHNIIPVSYPGATYRHVHSPHSYPEPSSDAASIYALFVERVIQRQVDALCRKALVSRGADASKVQSMRSCDSHANHCFLYVEDKEPDGTRLEERQILQRIGEREDEFGLPKDHVRVVSGDEGLPAYVTARAGIYHGASSFKAFFDSRMAAIRHSYRTFVANGADPGTREGAVVLSDVAMCAFLAYGPPKTYLLFSKASVDGGEMAEFNRGLFSCTREIVSEMLSYAMQEDASRRVPDSIPTVASNDFYMSSLGVGFDMDVSSRTLHGVCDLVIGTTVVDIKCSSDRNSSISMQWVLQLLCYCALARKRGIRVDTIAVYNPMKGSIWTAPVAEWDKDSDLLSAIDDLMSAEIGVTLGAA